MVRDSKEKSVTNNLHTSDAFFRNSNDASDFFKRKDRSRDIDTAEAIGIRTISWNCTGTFLAAGSDNRGVSVSTLDGHTCRLKNTFSTFEHDDAVEAVEFSKHDEQLLASCSNDRTVRLWDMRMSLKARIAKIPTKEANLFICWSHCGRWIAYGDKSDTISLLETRTNKVVESLSFKAEINEFICNSEGDLFVTTDHGKLEIFNMSNLKRKSTVQAHPQLSACQAVAASPQNERYLAVGGSDAVTSIWDLSDMICVQTLNRLDYPIRSVSFSHCGNMVASGSEDRLIDISWALSGEKVIDVPIKTECFVVAWHPRLYLLAYATGIATSLDIRDRDRDISTLKVFGYSGGS